MPASKSAERKASGGQRKNSIEDQGSTRIDHPLPGRIPFSDFYEDLGSTYVRMDKKLRDHLYEVYAGKGDNDLRTVSDIVWHLANKDIDFSVVEHDHPEVKEWLLKAAEDRNAAYARRVTREVWDKGGKIARVELE